MTVHDAILRVRAVGELTVTPHGNIRLRVPAERREELAPAVQLLRDRKAEAVTVASGSSTSVDPNMEYGEPERLPERAARINAPRAETVMEQWARRLAERKAGRA